jgi:hypothetical protein
MYEIDWYTLSALCTYVAYNYITHLCICFASYNTIKKKSREEDVDIFRSRTYSFRPQALQQTSPICAFSYAYVSTCAICSTTKKKKEMQAKLNRLYTKNKERGEKKNWWTEKNGPCGEWCEIKQLSYINITLTIRDKQGKTMDKIYM